MYHTKMYKQKIILVRKLPPFYDVAEYLWGKGVDIDSDGNSQNREDQHWCELTLILRKDITQRIDIDPLNENSKELLLVTTTQELLLLVLIFLKQYGSIN